MLEMLDLLVNIHTWLVGWIIQMHANFADFFLRPFWAISKLLSEPEPTVLNNYTGAFFSRQVAFEDIVIHTSIFVLFFSEPFFTLGKSVGNRVFLAYNIILYNFFSLLHRFFGLIDFLCIFLISWVIDLDFLHIFHKHSISLFFPQILLLLPLFK